MLIPRYGQWRERAGVRGALMGPVHPDPGEYHLDARLGEDGSCRRAA